MLKRGIAMGKLIGTKLLDRRLQVRILWAQSSRLLAIMIVDHLFDGDGAGHRRARSHPCGHGAEREAGNPPDRRQQRRTHPAFSNQPVEGFEVALFLLGHFSDRVARRSW